MDAGSRARILLEKALFFREEIAACRALGGANAQEQGRNLVFNLDGMHDPVVVFTRAVDENDRERADRDQHQESRRKQQGLPDGTSGRRSRQANCRAGRNQNPLTGNTPALKTSEICIGSVIGTVGQVYRWPQFAVWPARYCSSQ